MGMKLFLLTLASTVALQLTPGLQSRRCAAKAVQMDHAAAAAAAVRVLSSSISMQEATADPEMPVAPAADTAYIEFIIGVPEPVVPDVALTRSKDGSTGVATFTFDNPSFLQRSTEALGETTGMYLKDAEGTLKTSEVTATFTNGKPRFVKGIIVMNSPDEWDRFMRFMERYADANGLGFSKA